MTVNISPNETAKLTEYIENTLSDADAPMGAIIKMNIALDEIFSNIVKFSGASYASVNCYVENSVAHLIFEDDGIPYDPLAKADPNTALGIEERDIGGLGIFMVKKSMSEMSYEYSEGKNILMLKLEFN